MNVPVSTAADVKSNIFIRSELFLGGPVINSGRYQKLELIVNQEERMERREIAYALYEAGM